MVGPFDLTWLASVSTPSMSNVNPGSIYLVTLDPIYLLKSVQGFQSEGISVYAISVQVGDEKNIIFRLRLVE